MSSPTPPTDVRRRSLEQLVVEDDALRGFIEPQMAASDVDVDVVAPDPARSATSLQRLQVTTHSTLGALVFLTGGLRVDHGWLRIIGGPTETFPFDPWSLASEFGLAGDDPDRPDMLVVGVDVLGGVFGLDGGVLGSAGQVFYFAPDSLSWERLGFGHPEFVAAMISSRVRTFYDSLRWVSWQADVGALEPSQGIAAYPPAWTVEGKSLDRVSRRAVPLTQIVSRAFEVARQLGDALPTDR
jgi:hypothetical protein